MAKVAELWPGIWFFHCPGCGRDHPFHVGAAHPDGRGWQFNGDPERPTFSPILLVLDPERRCHSFVRDGNVQFLNDCWYPLREQTVEIPDWERPEAARE